jgi:hypothetical protein
MKRGPYVDEKKYPGCELFFEDLENIYEIFTSVTPSQYIHITADNFALDNFKELLDIKKDMIDQLEIQTVLQGGHVIGLQFNKSETALYYNDETIILGMITRIEKIINLRKRFFGNKINIWIILLLSFFSIIGSFKYLLNLNLLIFISVIIFSLSILMICIFEILRGKYNRIHLIHWPTNINFITKYRDWIIAFTSAILATLLGFLLERFF